MWRMSVSAYTKRIDAHYAGLWGEPTASLRWNRGPITDLPGDFRVSVYQRASGVVAHATRCMSQPGDAEPLELHLLSRATGNQAEPKHVEILTAVAHYHRNGRPLGVGHTVNFGTPLTPGSSCTHGLLSVPYLDGPDLEWSESSQARFLWLIPVTMQEVEYKRGYGIEALEDRLEEAKFDYLDLHRSSVI